MKRPMCSDSAPSKKARKQVKGRQLSLYKTPSNSVVHQHLKFSVGAIAGNVAYTPYTGAYSITLANLSGYSELVALYDQYRIDFIEVSFHLKVGPDAQAAGAATYPKIWWSRDLDDASTVTQAQMYERANTVVKVLNPDKPVVFRFKPNTLSVTYRTPATSGYSPKFGQWIDCSQADVVHYGAQFNIDNLSNTNYTVDQISRVWVSCKNSI